MTKRVKDTAAGKSISAYVIMKGAKHVATVRAHHGGRVTVNVHDDKAGLQSGTAGGGGYDKFTAALSGMTIDGHAMTNHCGARLPLPRGKKFFPADYKAPPGWRLSNGAEFDAVTGERRDSYHWRDMAIQQIGESDWEAVNLLARKLHGDANTVRGYSDCYRESGLNYLTARGYNVIKAI